MIQNITPIDAYIKKFPIEIRQLLVNTRNEIKKITPAAEETISYGIPTFKINGVNIVHFAAFKRHIGFYPTPAIIEAFKKELAPYKQAKGSVQFPYAEALPIKLIAKMTKSRLKMLNNSK